MSKASTTGANEKELSDLRAQVAAAEARAASAEQKLREVTAEKHGAYHERNQLVAALSKLWPSHWANHPEDDATWDDEWRTIICIHSPVGQLTWHIKIEEQALFTHLPKGANHWDGHTTEQKYQRLASFELASAEARAASAEQRAQFEIGAMNEVLLAAEQRAASAEQELQAMKKRNTFRWSATTGQEDSLEPMPRRENMHQHGGGISPATLDEDRARTDADRVQAIRQRVQQPLIFDIDARADITWLLNKLQAAEARAASAEQALADLRGRLDKAESLLKQVTAHSKFYDQALVDAFLRAAPERKDLGWMSQRRIFWSNLWQPATAKCRCL